MWECCLLIPIQTWYLLRFSKQLVWYGEQKREREREDGERHVSGKLYWPFDVEKKRHPSWPSLFCWNAIRPCRAALVSLFFPFLTCPVVLDTVDIISSYWTSRATLLALLDFSIARLGLVLFVIKSIHADYDTPSPTTLAPPGWYRLYPSTLIDGHRQDDIVRLVDSKSNEKNRSFLSLFPLFLLQIS